MRVLVVRPGGQAEATGAALRERGHAAIVAPLVEIVPTGTPMPAGLFDALLVTSGNAVPALTPPPAALADCPVFAVGAQTAGRLGAAGWPDVRFSAGDGADLARFVSLHVPAGKRLLHAAGRDRRPEPGATLAAGGFEVVVWETYAAETARALPDATAAALRDGRLDAALHYSARSAATLVALASAAGLEPEIGRLLHVCLSGRVAAALGSVPANRIAVAERPTEASLLARLDAAAAAPSARPRMGRMGDAMEAAGPARTGPTNPVTGRGLSKR